jgi:hypothetical protein
MKKKRKLFIRHPIPSKQELKNTMDYWAKRKKTSLGEELLIYYSCLMDNINKSNEIIKKEIMRIEKTKKCLEIATDLLREDEK